MDLAAQRIARRPMLIVTHSRTNKSCREGMSTSQLFASRVCARAVAKIFVGELKGVERSLSRSVGLQRIKRRAFLG